MLYSCLKITKHKIYYSKTHNHLFFDCEFFLNKNNRKTKIIAKNCQIKKVDLDPKFFPKLRYLELQNNFDQ